MGIYLGDTKVTGTGVQIDNSMSSTSTHAVTNAAITEALSEVGYTEWKKPTDWIDIQGAALQNSIYFLVAHSAPVESGGTYTVATYPQLKVQTTVSSSGTYDVYVDGVKVATTASATVTTLDWGALYTAGTIVGGFNVTHPSALTTHVVRITPTTGTNTMTAIQLDSSISEYGILWIHFQIANAISLNTFSGSYSYNYKCALLEAVTSQNDELQILTGFHFKSANSLQHLPLLIGNNTTIDCARGLNGCTSLKKIRLKNTKFLGNQGLANSGIEVVETDNAYILCNNYTLSGCDKLKKLPPFIFEGQISGTDFVVVGSELEPTFVDASSGSSLKGLTMNGISSTNRADGIKGVIVSSSAPFNNSSSPQLNVSYTGMDRAALVALFNSLPTVSASQVCNITGCTGAADLTAEDIAIAVNKGWSVTR